MSQRKPFYFLIERNFLEEYVRIQGVAGLLDMLRYDSCIIEPNPPEGYYLLSTEKGPTEARWNSFGITIIFKDDHYQPFKQNMDAVDWGRKHLPRGRNY